MRIECRRISGQGCPEVKNQRHVKQKAHRIYSSGITSTAAENQSEKLSWVSPSIKSRPNESLQCSRNCEYSSESNENGSHSIVTSEPASSTPHCKNEFSTSIGGNKPDLRTISKVSPFSDIVIALDRLIAVKVQSLTGQLASTSALQG